MHICFLNFCISWLKASRKSSGRESGQGAGGSIFETDIQKCHIQVHSRAETSQLHYLSKSSELRWQNVFVLLSSSQAAMPQLLQVNPVIIKIPKHPHPHKLTTVMKQNRNVNALRSFQTVSIPNLSPDDLNFPFILLLLFPGICFQNTKYHAWRAWGRRDSTVWKWGQTALDCINNSTSFLSKQAGTVTWSNRRIPSRSCHLSLKHSWRGCTGACPQHPAFPQPQGSAEQQRLTVDTPRD